MNFIRFFFVNKIVLVSVVLLSVTIVSCSKSSVESSIVYGESSPSLVKYTETQLTPSSGGEGTIVTIPVTGLGDTTNIKYTFYFNGMKADVLSIADNKITARVPANASTGNVSTLINGQYYYGPKFTVNGKVSIDPNFNVDAYRSDASILGIVPYGNGNYYIYGLFSDYASKASSSNIISGLSIITTDGAYASKQIFVGNALGEGLNGKPSAMLQTTDSRFVVGGSFTECKDLVENLNGVVRIKQSTSADSIEVQQYQVLNANPHDFPDRSYVTGGAINGGISGSPLRIFQSPDASGYIFVGNYSNYTGNYYEGSLYNSIQLDVTSSKQITKINLDGSFDSSFNFNKSTNKSYDAANAYINDAIQDADGNIIAVGNFTTFNGQVANRIVKISASTGLAVSTFNSGGSGADGMISKITYNAVTHKLLIVGFFKSYNGISCNGVAMLNMDGTLDTTFNFRQVSGGIPTFAFQMNNGKILVAGTFNSYDDIVRAGFIVLNANGSLATGYNNTGLFRGYVYGAIETTSSLTGYPAVILVGLFDRFDATSVANIVKVVFEN